MTQTESLIAKLGLDKGDFTRGLATSIDDVKGFQRLWLGLSRLLGAGGMVAAVRSFFTTIIEHARESKDALDANTAAVMRFGDALDQAKKTGKDWGVQFIGYLNQAGEAMGFFTKWVASGFSKKMADDERALVRTQQESAEAQVVTARERAAHGAEYENITRRIAAAERAVAEEMLRQLSPANRVAQLSQELVAIDDKLQAGGLTKIEQRRLEAEHVEKALALTRAQGDQEKALEAEDEKRNDAWVKLQERRRQIAFEQLSTEEKINKLQTEEKDLVAMIAEGKKRGSSTTELETKLLDVQIAQEVLINQQTEQQARAAAEIVEAMRQQVVEAERIKEAYAGLGRETGQIMVYWQGIEKSAVHMLNAFGGKTLNQASDAALQELVRQDKARLADVEQASHFRPLGPSIADDLAKASIQQEIKNATDQLEFRQKLRADVGRVGVEGARRYYDPMMFDRLVEQYVKVLSTTEKQTSLLTEINDRLRPVLPRG